MNQGERELRLRAILPLNPMNFLLRSLAIALALSLAAVGQKSTAATDVPEIRAIPAIHETDRQTPEQTAPNVPASIARPILFVHGWCGDDVSWLTTAQALRNLLMATRPQDYQNAQIYGAFYRGFNGGVQFYDLQTFEALSQSQIPSSARFFVIELIDPRQTGATAPFDPSNVAQIPISVKASEVAEVLSSIQDITFIQDTIVVAHSMGGLVSRAYVEGLGSHLSSVNGQYFYTTGSLAFNPNLGSIITIDSPHSGAPVSLSEAIIGTFFTCGGLNRSEMIPGDSHSVIEPLNYFANSTLNGAVPKSMPTGFPIHSIKSYNTFDWGGTPNSDGVIVADTQDIRLALQGHIPVMSNFQSLDNFEGTRPGAFPPACSEAGFYVLHFIECVGVQNSTLSLLSQSISADMLGVPLGVFSVAVPQSLVGGTAGSGSLTLTTGAAVHGATVQLSSDDASVQVPTNISFLSGTVAANFGITAAASNIQRTVHITASYGRTADQVATITVLPNVAQVQLSKTTVSFSHQLVNLRSAGTQVLLTNSGVAPLSINSIIVSGAFEQSNNCSNTLAVGASCAINVVFHPLSLGNLYGTLTITDNAPGSPHTISLAGTGFDITLNVPRPTRTRRGQNGTTTRQETLVEFSAGGVPLPPISVKCLTKGCTAGQAGINTWRVILDQRPIRLGRNPKSVMLQATIQGVNREFVVQFD